MAAPAKVKLCIPGVICLTAFIDRDKDPARAADHITVKIEAGTGYELTEREQLNLIDKIKTAQLEEG